MRSATMADTDTPRALLIVALQDLHDAELAWMERAAELQRNASYRIGTYLAEEARAAQAQAERLAAAIAALNGEVEGPPNIWLRAILDDAARDADTIAAGPLRDIALVGAFRKGKQAERVSYETAISLARRMNLDAMLPPLVTSRDEEARTDAALVILLDAIIRDLPV
jgi:ferritin-like metal-binding protein YciE